MGKNGLYHKTKRRKEKELEKRKGHKGEEVDGISVEDVIVGIGNQKEKKVLGKGRLAEVKSRDWARR